MKPGTYVTDRSDSGRYDRAVYSIISILPSGATALVRTVGYLQQGRIEYTRERHETHRTIANLRVWE